MDISLSTAIAAQSIGLEKTLAPLELSASDSLRNGVVEYFQRVPSGPRSKPRWTPESYPTGREKELYAEFSSILLSDPLVTVPALLQQFHTPVSEGLWRNLPSGQWRAYRLSTRRLGGADVDSTPMGFPGVAGCGGIADVGLFLNPSFDGKGDMQMNAERILLFEIKSRDYHHHKTSQLSAHLKAIARDDDTQTIFLGAVGGRRIHIQHPRWLGHVTLNEFLGGMGRVVNCAMGNAALALEIESVRHFRCKIR